MFGEVTQLGPRGRKISKWIMVVGLVLIVLGFGTMIVLGFDNIPRPMINPLFFSTLIGWIMFTIGYSGYSGAVLTGRFFTKKYTKGVSEKEKQTERKAFAIFIVILFLLFLVLYVIKTPGITTTATTTTTTLVTATTMLYSYSCQELEQTLVNHIDMGYIQSTITECDAWLSTNEPIIVGGTLADFECNYTDTYNHYECDFTFEALGETAILNVVTYSQPIPYETDRFYKFDMGEYCKRIYSMALSGSIVDRDFDVLELMDC